MKQFYEYSIKPISELAPYAKNSRTHSKKQINQIAASIKEFGFTNPILVDDKGGIIAGHGRALAAKQAGMETVPTITITGLTAAQKRALVISDNKLALNAGWDTVLLSEEIGDLKDDGYDISILGFEDDELADLLEEDQKTGLVDDDEVPEVQPDPISKTGDVWILGKHRVMCGDSTVISDVEKLVAGNRASLLHADPPYGMGKASEGVANDNLYREKLDAFQMEWWATFRTFVDDNASAYIWGNAPDLWRLWYRGGLADSERLELRNEIVWDKKSIPGMKSPLMTQYPEASERCLYFQIGDQFLGNINSDDFPEAWEPLRSYMESQASSCGIKSADIKRVCGCSMYSHWFTRAQFTLIPEVHYLKLQSEYPKGFPRKWKDLKSEWDTVRGNGRDVINGKLEGMRSYFDNAHDSMRDVWEFSRVIGEERHGHATPKPVAMMERVMRSSLIDGGLCLEPFGGSGSTLIGAEKTGRVCYSMEMQGVYVDVIVKRWQKWTGKKAILESTGQTFDELSKK